jgi:hypothetical protein
MLQAIFFFTGSFSGTIDFDPGPGEFIVSNCSPGCMNGTDIFVGNLMSMGILTG